MSTIQEHVPATAHEAGHPFVELNDRWLRVHFGANTRPRHADFHYVWLRHNCDRERHPSTGERTIDPVDIDADVSVHSAHVDTAAGALEIVWRNSGHRSRFDLGWLAAHAYGAERVAFVPPPSDVRTVTVSWTHDESLDALVRQSRAVVAQHGLVVVRDRVRRMEAPDDTERLVEAFDRGGLRVVGTHFGRIEDLRTDNTTNANTDQLGYTDAAIQLHTDQPFLASPPRYQLLHSMRAAHEGGANAIVDAHAAARALEVLDADAFALLTSTPVRFHRKQKAFEAVVVAPILSFEGPRFRVRYSYFTMAPFDLPFERMESWYRAYRRFAQIVRDPSNQYRFTLEPGDFVLYDNHRMLHARTAFRGPRWVRGVYFDA